MNPQSGCPTLRFRRVGSDGVCDSWELNSNLGKLRNRLNIPFLSAEGQRAANAEHPKQCICLCRSALRAVLDLRPGNANSA